MDRYEQKLKAYINHHKIDAKHLSFNQSCHTVEEAAKAVDAPITELAKSICLVDQDGKLIVAIVKGEDRASTTNVAKALRIERPRIATPNEILEKTGYPCGGTPAFGYDSIFLIDERVMEKELIYSGGGSDRSLVKISPKELLMANSAKICRIRK